MFGIPDPILSIIQKALGSIVVVVVAIGLERFSRVMVRRRITDRAHGHTLHMLVRNSTYFLAGVIVLMTWLGVGSSFTVTMGILGAGIAFASQEVIGSFAGYINIVTSSLYHIGDRVRLGDVTGDVLDISILRTTVMEIGEWVNADQYTGRVVTVANRVVFSAPVFNYTEHWPFIWDEITLPITYASDWRRAEEIMLTYAAKYTGDIETDAKRGLDAMRRRYLLAETAPDPLLYIAMTDNWIEMTLRYVVRARERRRIRTELQRELLEALEQEPEVNVASATYEIVGFPTLKFEGRPSLPRRAPGASQGSPPASDGLT